MQSNSKAFFCFGGFGWNSVLNLPNCIFCSLGILTLRNCLKNITVYMVKHIFGWSRSGMTGLLVYLSESPFLILSRKNSSVSVWYDMWARQRCIQKCLFLSLAFSPCFDQPDVYNYKAWEPIGPRKFHLPCSFSLYLESLAFFVFDFGYIDTIGFRLWTVGWMVSISKSLVYDFQERLAVYSDSSLF